MILINGAGSSTFELDPSITPRPNILSAQVCFANVYRSIDPERVLEEFVASVAVGICSADFHLGRYLYHSIGNSKNNIGVYENRSEVQVLPRCGCAFSKNRGFVILAPRGLPG